MLLSIKAELSTVDQTSFIKVNANCEKIISQFVKKKGGYSGYLPAQSDNVL